MVRMQVTGVVTTFLTWQVAHGPCEWHASARQTIDLIDLGEKAIAVRKALPRPLTLVMMASLLMEEGALNKFQYIGMVAFLAMRLCDYHHRYLGKPHIYYALCVMDYSSARFTSILLFSILAPIFSAVRRRYISD